MTKISKNPNQIPKWCSISRELVPDFIVIDPKKSPVWEITVKISYLFLSLNQFDFFRVPNFLNLNNIQLMVYPFDFHALQKSGVIKHGKKQQVLII